MSLNETEELCKQLGGELPSVHSQEDTNFLMRLIGRNSRVWLGGQRMSSTPGGTPNKNYTWLDGSPMDYFPFVADHELCKASCCGIGYTTVVSPGLVVKECTSKRRMICGLTAVTQAFEDDVLNSTINGSSNSLNSTSAAFQAMKILSSLNFDLLNETITRAKESTRENEKITSLTNDFAKFGEDIRSSVAQIQAKVDGSLNSVTQELNLLTFQLNKQKTDFLDAIKAINQSLIRNSKSLIANVSEIQGMEEKNYRVMRKSASYHTDAIIGIFILIMCLGLVFYFRDNLWEVKNRASSFVTYIASRGRTPPSATARRQRLRNDVAGFEDKDPIFNCDASIV
jgi:hypothetical protein